MFESRKIFIFLILFGLFAAVSSAQGLGIKMHYNFAKSSWQDPNSTSFLEEYASKYALGPYFELRPILFLSFSVEGLLDKKGGIISSPNEKGIEYRLTYFSIHLLINWYVFPKGPIQFFVSGGIEYSLLLEGKVYDLDNDQEMNDETKDKFAKSDTSYILGIGLQIDLGITRMILEGRYTIGQKDIFLPQFLEVGESLKNKVLSFGIGFKF